VWDAAAAPSSLVFVLVGLVIVLPFMLAYAVFL
jgi:cytochrome bd-type quinol oxidase subunit 2